MEFKGTKGRWVIYNECEKQPLGHNYGIMNNSIFEVVEKDICSVWHDSETGIEAIYNAKLISKAPEILEDEIENYSYMEDLAMLIPSEFWTEKFRDRWNAKMSKTEMLIKEATTI